MADERPPAQYRLGKDRELHGVPDAESRKEAPSRGKPLTSKPVSPEPPPRVNRHVTKRDGGLEGGATSERESPAKERARDLTSLSTPVPDDEA